MTRITISRGLSAVFNKLEYRINALETQYIIGQISVAIDDALRGESTDDQMIENINQILGTP